MKHIWSKYPSASSITYDDTKYSFVILQLKYGNLLLNALSLIVYNIGYSYLYQS